MMLLRVICVDLVLKMLEVAAILVLYYKFSIDILKHQLKLYQPEFNQNLNYYLTGSCNRCSYNNHTIGNCYAKVACKSYVL